MAGQDLKNKIPWQKTDLSRAIDILADVGRTERKQKSPIWLRQLKTLYGKRYGAQRMTEDHILEVMFTSANNAKQRSDGAKPEAAKQGHLTLEKKNELSYLHSFFSCLWFRVFNAKQRANFQNLLSF